MVTKEKYTGSIPPVLKLPKKGEYGEQIHQIAYPLTKQKRKNLTIRTLDVLLKNIGESLPVIKGPNPNEARLSPNEMMKRKGKKVMAITVAGIILGTGGILYGLQKNYNFSLSEVLETARDFYKILSSNNFHFEERNFADIFDPKKFPLE